MTLRILQVLALAVFVPACFGPKGTSIGTPGVAGIPVISSFTATPTPLAAGGGPVTLSWSVTGADQLSIDQDVGVVSGSTVETTVTSTTMFTLTASNGSGSATSSALVTVNPSPQTPVILSFTVSPQYLPAAGGSVTLQWNVLNATGLSIDPGVGPVTGTSKVVAVTSTTVFTLTASNGFGSTSTASAVTVGAYPPTSGGRYVAMVAPSNGEQFIAPATLRLVGAAHDPNV